MASKYLWTNHAIKRLKERKIPRKLIDKALYHPDKIYKKGRSIEQQKTTNGKTVAAIIKENEQGEKIIVSCWVNPPFPGTKDYKKRQRYLAIRKAPLMKKLWLIFLTKIGL